MYFWELLLLGMGFHAMRVTLVNPMLELELTRPPKENYI
jgi:hypothetical protein